MMFRQLPSVAARSILLGLIIGLMAASSGCALMKAKAHQAAKAKQPNEFSCSEKHPPSQPLH